MGVLGWTPETFWNATPREFHLAMNGWAEKNGVKQTKPARMSRDRLKELMERYPDG